MRTRILLVKALMLLIISAGNAFAAPGSGFGLNIGMANSSMNGTTTPAGAAYSYSSSGVSIGMDYQFALSDSFSISPIFMISASESLNSTLKAGTIFSGAQPPNSAGHGILGLQLRYWMGDFFVGGHVGSYAEFLSNINANTNTQTDTVGEGMGRGLVVGWEPSKSKWFLMGQVDTANIGYVGADVKLIGTRVSIGYRWK